MPISKQITDFINYIDGALAQYRVCENEYETANKLQNDLLHAIEFNAEGHIQRNRLAKQLEECRRDRRFYKDRVQELEPLVKFFEDANNKKAYNLLKNTLGELRKVESFHKDRIYWPRSADPVLKKFFWESKKRETKKPEEVG